MVKKPIKSRIRFRCSAITRIGVIATLLGFAAYEYGARGQSDGPDAVASFPLTGVGIDVWGRVGGTQAYSAWGGVCNLGDTPLPGEFLQHDDILTRHPMWTSNLYRLANNRFEQIGMSWVKHDDWSTALGPCTACGVSESACIFSQENPPTPEHLDPGCRDTYTCQNGCQTGIHGNLGPRSQINPTTGVWPVAPPGRWCDPATGDVIACRLQVEATDFEGNFANALFFLEEQVITSEQVDTPDLPETNRNNNMSYRQVTVDTCISNLCSGVVCASFCLANRSCPPDSCIHPITVTADGSCQVPAISAWKDSDPSNVMETPIPDQNGGKFILSAKATSIGWGWWRYEYALYNMNSDRSAGGFHVTLPTDLCPPDVRIISADNFHDIHYHSGDQLLFDGVDWEPSIQNGEVSWTIATNSTNALRWGTLYNFRFETERAPDSAPMVTNITINLFKSGTPSYVTGVSVAPASAASPVGPAVRGQSARFAPKPAASTPADRSKVRVAIVRIARQTGLPIGASYRATRYAPVAWTWRSTPTASCVPELAASWTAGPFSNLTRGVVSVLLARRSRRNRNHNASSPMIISGSFS